MSMYRRILVAVDGSPTSNKAVKAALEIASYSGGRSVVRLIHALDDMAYLKGLDPYSVPSYSVINLMAPCPALVVRSAKGA